MKKLILFGTFLCCSVGLVAQDNPQIQNKNGVDIMPVQGEFGLGMNAVPVFNYLGDIFGYNGNNTAMGSNKFVSYFSSNTIFGKYMLTDDNAVRGHLRIAQYNSNFDNDVFDDIANHPDTMVVDNYRSTQTIINIGAGYEWRRGKTRLKGIYGGEVMYQYRSGASRDYTYGNAFGLTNPAPTATSWSSGGGVLGEGPIAERLVSQNTGNFNGLGVRAFAGVEYYFAPKMCFGTEFGWALMGGFNGRSQSVTEYWDPAADGGNGAVLTNDIEGSKGRTLSLDTDNFGGSLYFMFYF